MAGGKSQAAAKIQAHYRSKKARKRVAGIRQARAKGDEAMAGGKDGGKVQAIKRLQARHRGKQARRRVRKLKTAPKGGDTKAEGEGGGVREEISPEDVQKVTKLQAFARGKIERRRAVRRANVCLLAWRLELFYLDALLPRCSAAASLLLHWAGFRFSVIPCGSCRKSCKSTLRMPP